MPVNLTLFFWLWCFQLPKSYLPAHFLLRMSNCRHPKVLRISAPWETEQIPLGILLTETRLRGDLQIGVSMEMLPQSLWLPTVFMCHHVFSEMKVNTQHELITNIIFTSIFCFASVCSAPKQSWFRDKLFQPENGNIQELFEWSTAWLILAGMGIIMGFGSFMT